MHSCVVGSRTAHNTRLPRFLGLLLLLAASAAGARPWDLSAYQKCHDAKIGGGEITGLTYNPKDDLVWAVSSMPTAALRAYDLQGHVRKTFYLDEGNELKGVSWLYGDTFALTLPGQQRIGFTNVYSGNLQLTLRYVPFRMNTVARQDKVTYNAEDKALLVTDLGPGPASDAKLSLVMLNGVVMRTTDSTIAAQNITDIYYATQPRKLFALSGTQREVLEIGGEGAVEFRLSLKDIPDRPVGFTFSPDGGKLIVLGAGGSMAVYSAHGCDGDEPIVSRRSLRSAMAPPSRRVLGLASSSRGPSDSIPVTENSMVELRSSSMQEIAGQIASNFDLQNEIYLYYLRLPTWQKNYLDMYSLCELHNLTDPRAGHVFSGLSFDDKRKSVWTITGSPAMMAEYSIAGTLDQDIPIGLPVDSMVTATDIAHVSATKYAIMDSEQKFTMWDIAPGHTRNAALELQTPAVFKHTKLAGLTWDDETGRFFVAQVEPPAVWSVAENSPPVLLFTGAKLPLQDITGVAHNRYTNTLLLMSSKTGIVVETSVTGEFLGHMSLPSRTPSAGRQYALSLAGGGKVLFMLSSWGSLQIYSIVKC